MGLCVSGWLGLGGCAGHAPPPAVALSTTPDGRAQVEADWSDAEAAAKVGLAQMGIAVLRVDRADPGRYVFSLLTALDEPGKLVIERLAPPEQADPVAIALSSTIGRFGDPQREGELVRRVAARLEQLRGVEVAPIRR